MKWPLLTALAVLLGLAGAGPAAAAKRPSACQLYTKALAEDYFNTDMTAGSSQKNFCDYQARLPRQYKGGNLRLTPWRLESNARSTINAVCGQKEAKPISIRNVDRACGFEGKTGLCVNDGCQIDVTIAFRRGRTTGVLELASLEAYTLNTISNGAKLARRVLARWP